MSRQYIVKEVGVCRNTENGSYIKGFRFDIITSPRKIEDLKPYIYVGPNARSYDAVIQINRPDA